MAHAGLRSEESCRVVAEAAAAILSMLSEAWGCQGKLFKGH